MEVSRGGGETLEDDDDDEDDDDGDVCFQREGLKLSFAVA